MSMCYIQKENGPQKVTQALILSNRKKYMNYISVSDVQFGITKLKKNYSCTYL